MSTFNIQSIIRVGHSSGAIMRKPESMAHRSSLWRKTRHSVVIALATFTLSLGWAGNSAAQQPATFKTPEAAATAMVEALAGEGFDALLKLLGSDFEEELKGGDETAARVQLDKVLAAAKAFNGLRSDGEDRRIMLLGTNVWPMPFPITRKDGRWSFDTAAGIEEVVNRRIGRNELNAISVARAFILAQREYASVDRDGDEVREYATRIGSRAGKRDGLYWPADDENSAPSPFGPLVAEARSYFDDSEPGDPYQGYYFRVLTRQGLNPPGGRYDYVINNNMIGGFALLAFPADYGNSGIMTFVVSHQGKILQKDLGDNTEFIAGAMQEYDPDETWALVED